MGQIIGTNKRCIPSLLRNFGVHTVTEVTTVLVEGQIGDCKAYIGVGPDEFVAKHGNQISFEEAKVHFPMIEKEKYRR